MTAATQEKIRLPAEALRKLAHEHWRTLATDAKGVEDAVAFRQVLLATEIEIAKRLQFNNGE